MAKTPPPLGSVNGFIASSAWIGAKRIGFNGTPLGLVTAVLAAGGTVGTRVMADLGGHSKRDAQAYTVIASGGGTRTPNGEWIQRDSITAAIAARASKES